MLDDEPVGMVGYAFNSLLKFRHAAEIHGVYVDSNHRGEGIGRAMLEQALSLIQKNKRIIKIELWANPKQRAAVNLYKKSGFLVAGKAKKSMKVGRNYYDMMLLEKML